MFGKENNRRMTLFLLANAESCSLQRGRPQAQQNAPRLFKLWSETGDLCAVVTPVRVMGPSSAEFGMVLAGDGSVSAPAGSCRRQKLLKCYYCSSEGLCKSCRILASPAHPNPSSTDTTWELLCPNPQDLLLPWAIPDTDPHWDHQERHFAKPMGQDFISGAADFVLIRQLGDSTFPAEPLG